MNDQKKNPEPALGAPAGHLECPAWCVTDHGRYTGEEDWVHASAPVQLTEEVTAQLCASVHPESGHVEGPHLLIGDREASPAQARRLARELLRFAALAAAP